MVAAAALAVSLTDAAAAAPLADLQGRKRVFLLFAPSQTTSLAQQSKDLLADKPGLAERDLVVLTVLGKDEPTPVFVGIPAPRGASAGALRSAISRSPSRRLHRDPGRQGWRREVAPDAPDPPRRSLPRHRCHADAPGGSRQAGAAAAPLGTGGAFQASPAALLMRTPARAPFKARMPHRGKSRRSRRARPRRHGRQPRAQRRPQGFRRRRCSTATRRAPTS